MRFWEFKKAGLICLWNVILIWGSGLLNWHEKGLGLLYTVFTIALIGTLVGYIWVQISLLRAEPELKLAEAVRSGLLTSVLTGLGLALIQLGYQCWFHPGFTDQMVEVVRQHYQEQGLESDAIQSFTHQARLDYGVKNSAIKTGGMNLIIGAFVTALVSAAHTLRKHR